jgi:hypothetical protein
MEQANINMLLTYIICLIIFSGVVLILWLKRLVNDLPATKHTLLEQLARTAVQYVEQKYKTSTSQEKKDFALAAIKTLLLAARLPLPNLVILDLVIEAAVYLLNQEQPETPQPVLPPKSIMVPTPPQKS